MLFSRSIMIATLLAVIALLNTTAHAEHHNKVVKGKVQDASAILEKPGEVSVSRDEQENGCTYRDCVPCPGVPAGKRQTFLGSKERTRLPCPEDTDVSECTYGEVRRCP